MPTPLEAALAYAARGWHVFPLQVGSKIPRGGSKGHLDATRDVQNIQRWWRENPNYNVGIACGEISGITVVDVDGEEGMASSKTIKGVPPTLTIKTPRGFHLYFKFNPAFSTGAGFLPGLDVRSGTIGGGDGGYVVAPPSVFDGKTYTIFKDLPLAELTTVPEEFAKGHRNGGSPQDTSYPTWVSEALAHGAPEHQRNDTATRLAGYFHAKEVPSDIILQVLTPFANSCTPPLEIRELEKLINSVGRYPNDALARAGEGRGKGGGRGDYIYKEPTYPIKRTSLDTNRDIKGTLSGTQEGQGDTLGTSTGTVPLSLSMMVQQWVDDSLGWSTVDEVDRDLGIRTVADKENRKKILTRLVEQGVIERNPKKNRQFRKRDRTLSKMNFRGVKRSTGVPLLWPLGIEALVNIYPGNLVVVAGDGNAGKTAFLLNVVRLNMERFDIHYFSSEMAEEELRIRLDLYKEMDIEEWNFSAYDRVRDFADVIVPDAINIVDFIEMTDDFNMAGKYLSDIWEKLGKGIGIVAMQKKWGQPLAKGAEATMDRSRLYLSITNNKATIVKGKNWATAENPNGLSMEFKLVQGTYFLPTTGWEKSD